MSVPASHSPDLRLPVLVLVVTLIQGSSVSLSFAWHSREVLPALEPLVNAVWALLYVVAVTGLFMRFGANWISWLIRYRLALSILLAGVLASALWSLDPWLTVERAVHLIGSSLLALYIGLTLPLPKLLRITTLVLVCILATSLLVALLLPQMGVEAYQGRTAWRGILASKNTLGFWAAAAVLLHLCGILGSRQLHVCLAHGAGLALAATMLAMGDSVTSVLALLAGVLLMAWIGTALRFRLGFSAMLALGGLCATILLLAIINLDAAEFFGRSRDLTGRAEVWRQTWQLIMHVPLGGLGYGTLWYPTPESLAIQQSLTDFDWTVFHAHNGLLQIASEIGLPLTALTVIFLVQTLVEVVYGQYRRQRASLLFVPAFIAALLISNYSEARLLVNRELYWILFIALPISLLHLPVPAVKAMQPLHIPTGSMSRPPDARYAAAIVSERRQRREIKARLRQQRSGARALPAPSPAP